MPGNIRSHKNLYCTILDPHNNHTFSTTLTSTHVHVQVCIMNISLPTNKETRLRITVTQSANTAIQCEVQQAKQPNKQAAAGTQVEEVDMRMSVVKELSSRWFITEALEMGFPEADPDLHLSENDPFSSVSD